eukprot:gnl/TRDRNA2_/TRDRNA2_190685_c0_seq1.p1 gnl/TRDRNA2_/TRDRNA2_190685_c0~~gnl/TRDRNA2_/TRDRNA2_190685_c0_seq1.p1  ORF type:complete len:152 (-),score=15.23 gnl/TRDRNA2_/TRDRNA2_190685_c0_seq1:86-541(-)
MDSKRTDFSPAQRVWYWNEVLAKERKAHIHHPSYGAELRDRRTPLSNYREAYRPNGAANKDLGTPEVTLHMSSPVPNCISSLSTAAAGVLAAGTPRDRPDTGGQLSARSARSDRSGKVKTASSTLRGSRPTFERFGYAARLTPSQLDPAGT